MKKLMTMMSIFLMTGLVSMEAVAQTPNSSRSNAAARKPAATAVTKQNGTSSSQAARQLRKGDAQLNKANDSYQKAQQSAATKRPTTTSSATSRPATTTSRPAASNNNATARPATSSSSTSRPTTATKPTTATTARPATSTTTSKQPATNVTTNRPVSSGTTANPANNAGKVESARPSSANASSSAVAERRGYTESGQAQPQPVSGPRDGGNSNNAGGDKPGPGGHPGGQPGGNHGGHPGGHPDGHGPHPGPAPHTPYVHPNYHNYYGHMHVPHHVRPVYYHGAPYYFYNGVFCRYLNGYYVICRPPLGAVIAYAIFNTWKPIIVVHNNVTYYYDDGTFYLPYNNNYQVVTPPIGARVAELPSNYEEIILDNTLYYKVDNVYYKAVVVNGYIWYEVVFVS